MGHRALYMELVEQPLLIQWLLTLHDFILLVLGIVTSYRSRHLVLCSHLSSVIGVSPSVAHVVRCFGPWLQ